MKAAVSEPREIVACMNRGLQATETAAGARHPAFAWLELIYASLDNADDLLREARMLHDAVQSPRALALAVLAFEEYGKAIQALVVLNSGGAPDEVANFEKSYRAHKPKLEAGGMWTTVLDARIRLDPGLDERVRTASHSAAGKKMDALYVDRAPDGRVSAPRSVITPEEQAVSIASATQLGESARALVGLMDTDEKVEAMWAVGPIVGQLLTEAIESSNASREQQVAAVRELLPQHGIQLLGLEDTESRDFNS